MVLEKPLPTKKLQKIEVLKVDSDYLIHPLKEVRFSIFDVISVWCLFVLLGHWLRRGLFFSPLSLSKKNRSDDTYSFPVGAIHVDERKTPCPTPVGSEATPRVNTDRQNEKRESGREENKTNGLRPLQA
jgi:hypothetical protein